MMGSVGGPGGRFLGRRPESSSLMTIATATTTGSTLNSKAIVIDRHKHTAWVRNGRCGSKDVPDFVVRQGWTMPEMQLGGRYSSTHPNTGNHALQPEHFVLLIQYQGVGRWRAHVGGTGMPVLDVECISADAEVG